MLRKGQIANEENRDYTAENSLNEPASHVGVISLPEIANTKRPGANL
jgi:hypothetical protein